MLARVIRGALAAASSSSRSLRTSAAARGGGGVMVHRDTPENNENTPFEFTAENKVVIHICTSFGEGYQKLRCSSKRNCRHHM